MEQKRTEIQNAMEILERHRIPSPSEKPEYALSYQQVLALENEYQPLEKGGYAPDTVYGFAEKLSDSINFDGQTDLPGLVRGLGGRITYLPYYEFKAEDGSVFLHDERQFDVILSDAVSPLRNRFTLAHELGHRILHRPKARSYAKRLDSTPVEWEANWFAAGFLMPEGRFLAAAKRFRNDALALSSLFGVSEKAAQVRLDVLQKKAK